MTNAEAEALILWPSDAKHWLSGKDPDAGKDRGQEEKGTTEDEMVGWHHRLNGHEFEQTQGDSEGQGSLVFCSSWRFKTSDTTWRLNNNTCKSKLLQVITSHWSERPSLKSLQIINAGEGVEKNELSYIVKMQIGTTTMETVWTFFKKLIIELP